MLEALVIAGIVAAPLGSAALFLPGRLHRQVTGTWPIVRRLLLAVIGTAVLAAAAAGVLELLHATEHNLIAGVAGLVAASLIWLPVTRRWSAAGAPVLGVEHLPVRRLPGLRARVDLRQPPRPGQHGRRRAALAARGVRGPAVAAPTCGRSATRWAPSTGAAGSPRSGAADTAVPSGGAARSSACMSRRTTSRRTWSSRRCASLLRLDYPRYEVILIDDNTDDEALWRPVEAWCAGHGVKFAHLEDWPGYKSGRAELRAAGAHRPATPSSSAWSTPTTRSSPGFLRGCAPLFADPWIGFVQAPQDYRDWEQRAATTAGSTTPTSTSSRSPSRRATSATARSSPAPWA